MPNLPATCAILSAGGSQREKSPTQVRSWLIERYGSWISYRPTAEPAAWPLWLTPIALLLIGAFLIRRRIGTRR